MIPEFKQALEEYALARADEQFMLGPRSAEWQGRGPTSAEREVLARIAQDELGHARLWYAWLAEMRGQDPAQYPERPPAEGRCSPLFALPTGDWAFTLARQFLLDAWEVAWSDLALTSPMPRIAELAAKIGADERDHLAQTSTWLKRFGRNAARRRLLQAGFDATWPHTAELFAATELDTWLLDAKVIPDPAMTRQAWLALVDPRLRAAGVFLSEAMSPGGAGG
ncbi:MAG TPA: phenylacetate-CoA oxygenase subunit PaaI [Thermoflexales bacterium]|nr:phenylacetate-CoA oxygenase subunit PaaI [Thermoflexales bacterium]HQZ55010.1 phenylacetate-CoA oxygenase subunit PaaI [Thermoflexales bacterium]